MTRPTPNNASANPDRDQRVAREAEALWRELYGEAPPGMDGGSLLDMICSGLPEVDYERLRTPYLRPSNIAYPRGS